MTTDESDDRRALLQSALEAIDELQAEVDRLNAARTEPIAIVGMSCRFPGGATSPERFWSLLTEGRDVVSTYAARRRDLMRESGVDVSTADAEGWYGGFLDDLEHFDPQFFGVSPREAASMDPQQRLVLESSWEALERAGIAPDGLNGSSTGIFVGVTGTDYAQLGKLGGPAALDVYSATGGALNAVPGRVAYTLGLQGPSMAIDTACSSSLVALHEACVSLRSGETDLALAGGVNVLLLPEAFVCFDRWGMMAGDGRCKTFDAAADGFVRGEGCGIVVLKRLADALADDDPIVAVVRGSAVNQDGRSSGLTVPNGPAQQAVLRRAYAAAGVDPADVQYFEAHGTGTTLGDPIEVEAMGAVLGRGRSADAPLFIGSVKTNIGHLESAAGIAGVMKVVLSMQHRQIPPHLHFHEPSPQIPWPDFDVRVPTAMKPWTGADGRLVAGVSGFGFSGTNAHVVLESPPTSATAPDVVDQGRRVVLLSAREEGGLHDLAGRLADRLDDPAPPTLADIATTMQAGRAHLGTRLAVVADSTEQLASRLRTVADGGGDGVLAGRAGRPRIGFAFTGQGSQYAGMARRLYDVEPAFRDALDRCASLVDRDLSSPLLDVVFAEPADGGTAVDRTGFTQPALFAVEHALAELWRSWGVVPEAVLGHSVGEIVAATVAGVFSVDDAARLITARGRLMQALPAGGSMAAVFAPADDVAPLVAELADVSIAAVNGPRHTVVSGAADGVASVTAHFAANGVRVQDLVVSHAFHSPLMAPMLDEFRQVASSISYRPPALRMISNVTGSVAGAEVATADYWVEHVMATVRFADGVAALHASGIDTFLEIGPHPVLTAMGPACLPADASATWVPALRRKRDDEEEILAAAGRLHTVGASVDWSSVRAPGRRVELPTTGFDRGRHWVDPPRNRPPAAMVHPLLGVHTPIPTLARDVFVRPVHPDDADGGDLGWLAEHRIHGEPVVPGTAFAEIAIAAGRHVGAPTVASVASLSIRQPLVVDDAFALQTVVGPAGGLHPDADAWEIQICSFPIGELDDAQPHPDQVTVHATATVIAPHTPIVHDEPAAGEIDGGIDGRVEIDVVEYYEQLSGVGIGYGPLFRGLVDLARAEHRAVGTIRIDPAAAGGFAIHPAQLDACFHVVGAALAGEGIDEAMYLPVGIEGLTLHRTSSPDAVRCHVELLGEPGEVAAARLRLVDLDGRPVADIDRLDLRRTSRAAFAHARRGASDRLLYETVWRSDTDREASALPAHCVLVAADPGFGERIATDLVRHGTDVTTIPAVDEGGSLAHRLDVALAQLTDGAGEAAVMVLHVVAAEDGLVADSGSSPVAGRSLGTAVDVAAACARARVERLVFVSRGGQAPGGTIESATGAGLSGLVRTVVAEQPSIDCRLVDLDPAAPEDTIGSALVGELVIDAGGEPVVALRGGSRHVPRLRRHRVAPRPDGPLALELGERGSLDRLTFRPLDVPTPGPGEIAVEVHATGVNFRDVLNVLGMYPGNPGNPGLECAGVVTEVGDGVDHVRPGDHVMGIAPDAYDDIVVTRSDLMVVMPPTMSFAEAAAIPIAYLTADVGLRRLAELGPGERVLIHAAAGGVGLAAVHLAMATGAEVFATAGSPAKHALLRSLGVAHVYGSRDGDFAAQILADTDGRGVDVVLNSLSDDLIDRSFECLAEGGRFLEIGKRGIWTTDEAAERRPDAIYVPYDLADVVDDVGLLQDALTRIVSRIERGEVPMLPLRSFPASRISDAFRHIAQAKHVGKVVIAHDTLRLRDRFDDGAYIVTGGLGGLGLVTADWLAERGAGAIVLVGRSAPGDDVRARLDAITERGTRVDVVAADIADEQGVASVLACVDESGRPLRGVVHAAGVVDDAVLTEQDRGRFESVASPKIDGAILLDRFTHGRPLDFFVAFSSASALMGSPGQANYATANAALDGLMVARAARGAPAVSIGWGAWSEVGMAAALGRSHQDRMAARGVGRISPGTGRQVLSSVAASPDPVLAAIEIDWGRLRQSAGGVLAPTFDELADERPTSTAPTADAGSFATDLEAASPEERITLVRDVVRSTVVAVLGLEPDAVIDPELGFADLGLDSLMAVELANRLGAVTGLALPTTVAFEYPTLAALAEVVADDLGVGSVPGDDVTEHAASRSEIEALSSDDVEALLLQELEDTGY